jgi:hypothetical protein
MSSSCHCVKSRKLVIRSKSLIENASSNIMGKRIGRKILTIDHDDELDIFGSSQLPTPAIYYVLSATICC